MASYVPVVKNGANGTIFYVGLVDQANTKLLKASPTIAAGDFKVSIDGGAFANLGTLPAVTPAAGRAVKITLSQAEVNGDNIIVQCVDAAGAEWCDLLINMQTSARQIDDLAYPATSGRSMVVDASGLVDANTVKVGPTGSGTAQTAGDIMADTNDIQSRLPAALVSGRMDSSVGAMAANVLTATAINADAITAAKVADGAIDAATFAAGAINAAAIAADAITAAKIADGAIDAATFAAGAINAAAIAADAIGASELAADAVAEIADAVWDEAIAGHLAAGSTGLALNSAGSAGDPWATALPGAYGAGSAGKIVGDNIDAKISSRLAPTVAARTLDVSAGGEAGIDWANIGSPTTAQNLSATNIDVDQVVASVSGAVGSVTGLVTANVTQWLGTAVGAFTPGVPEVDLVRIRSQSVPVPFVTGTLDVNVTHVTGTAQTAGDIIGDTNNIQTRLPAALVGARMDSSIGADAIGLATAANLALVKAKTDLIKQAVQKNTAFAGFHVFMTNTANEGVEGLTVSGFRLRTGDTLFAPLDNPMVELDAGLYKVDLTANDLNGDEVTLGFIANGAVTREITLTLKP